MDKRIRVVQMFYTFDVEIGGGGLSRFAIELGKKLDPNRFEVILCSLGKYDNQFGRQRIEQFNTEGIQALTATDWIIDKPYQSFLRSLRALRREFSQHPIDILHSHSEFTDVTALLLKLQSKAPIILRTVHYGYHEEWRNKPWRRAISTNFLYPILFDGEVGINQANTDRLNRRWMARLLRKQAIRIYNAIPLERFSEVQIDPLAKKVTLGIPPDAPVIGTVGRLADQKGYCYLIEAAPIVLQECPQARFLIVGDGPLTGELKNQASRLDLDPHIIFTGARSDVGELLACMDVFASSSLWEGLPTVLLESMVCNVPIVATDIPGTNELIQHGVNGWLVPPANPQELASAILKLLGDSSLRAKLYCNALETVKTFSIDSVARSYESLYNHLYFKRHANPD
jgi:glycosyltransferase involved in cell wall biosynthesis